jgi:hypothetical protein
VRLCRLREPNFSVLHVALLMSRWSKMDNVASAYRQAISSLINLQSECENNLAPEKLDAVNRILNDMKRRLRKIEPVLKDS